MLCKAQSNWNLGQQLGKQLRRLQTVQEMVKGKLCS